MATKTQRMEARVSPDERARIEQAAAASGVSVSAFIVDAAVQQADAIITASTTTAAPQDYFDALVAALDLADPAPRLEQAAIDAGRRRRIRAR
jgi:uncharacterized protein (DUF1778 family)